MRSPLFAFNQRAAFARTSFETSIRRFGRTEPIPDHTALDTRHKGEFKSQFCSRHYLVLGKAQ